MKDRNGCRLSVGDIVRFYVGNSNQKRPVGGRWATGIVREFYLTDTARVDDGDPKNPDIHTNGYRCSSWVMSGQVELDRVDI